MYLLLQYIWHNFCALCIQLVHTLLEISTPKVQLLLKHAQKHFKSDKEDNICSAIGSANEPPPPHCITFLSVQLGVAAAQHSHITKNK